MASVSCLMVIGKESFPAQGGGSHFVQSYKMGGKNQRTLVYHGQAIDTMGTNKLINFERFNKIGGGYFVGHDAEKILKVFG